MYSETLAFPRYCHNIKLALYHLSLHPFKFTQRTGSPVGPGFGLALVELQARLVVLDRNLGVLIPHSVILHTLNLIMIYHLTTKWS